MFVGAAGDAFITVALVAGCCMILAVPVHRIMSMWLMQELTGLEAVTGIGVMLAFVAGIISTWGSIANLFLWMLLIGLAIVFSLGGRVRNKLKMDEFWRDDVARAQRGLDRDPDNGAAHMRLGDLYEQRGDMARAIYHFQECIRIVPRDSEAKLQLSNAIEKQRRAELGAVACFSCGRENAETAAHCSDCGALISDKNQIIQFLAEDRIVKTILAVGAVSLVLALVGSVVRAVPAGVTLLSYLLLFLCMVCYVYPRRARAEQ